MLVVGVTQWVEGVEGGAWKATHWEAGNEHQRELREEQKFRDRRIPCEP